MTLQDSITNSSTVAELRAKGAAAYESVVQPAQEKLVRAAIRAKDTVTDVAHDVQKRAEDLSEAAVERGTEIASNLGDAASRNLRSAGSSARDFARRNPELLIAGAALVGLGIAAWLRGGSAAHAETPALVADKPKSRAPARQVANAKVAAKPKTTRKAT